MKIAEIVGSYADQEASELAPDSSLFRAIANAFTRSGKVKRPLNQQLSDGQPKAARIPFAPHAASDEDPAGDAVSEASSYIRRVSTQSCSSPQKSLAMAAAYNSIYHR